MTGELKPCQCLRCTKERCAEDPGETIFGQPVALMRMFGCQTGKAPYPTPQAAWHASAKGSRRRGFNTKAYRCPFCQQWHLADFKRPGVE